LKIVFSEAVLLTGPPLKMDTFLEMDFLKESPLKWSFSDSHGSIVIPGDVRGGMLV
jgi:hypothetical protein